MCVEKKNNNAFEANNIVRKNLKVNVVFCNVNQHFKVLFYIINTSRKLLTKIKIKII